MYIMFQLCEHKMSSYENVWW